MTECPLTDLRDRHQDAAIGELLRRWSDAKRQRMAHQERLDELRADLYRATDVLGRVPLGRQADGRRIAAHVDAIPMPLQVPEYPSHVALTDRVNQLRMACQEVADVARLLKAAGIEVGEE